MEYAVIFIAGYLLGSVPFGLLLTKMAGYGDIRSIGSGNIGATNVLRTGNKKLAALTLFLDGAKGAAAVLLAKFAMTFDASLYAAVGTFLGHLFPVWLKFKGGKGVATTLGIYFALLPILGAVSCLLWLATAIIFRFSSLAALVAVGLSPVIAWFLTRNFSATQTMDDGSALWLVNHHLNVLPYICAFMALLVFYKHKDNIRRLLKGEEPKIGKKKNEPAQTAG